MLRTLSLLVLLAAIVASGCKEKQAPVMVHYKPVSFWEDQLKNSDPKTRKKAVQALQAVGAADATAIPAIMVALKDPDVSVRDTTVLALLNIGPDARQALDALNPLKGDPNSTVRAHAAAAIERIQKRP